MLSQQPQQVGAAAGLDLSLEGVAAPECEPRLSERCGEARISRQPLLVNACRVHDRAAGAAWIGRQRGQGAGVVITRRGGTANLVEPRLN